MLARSSLLLIVLAVPLRPAIVLSAVATDSVLAWSTYFGGTGDEAEVVFDGIAEVALDADGNVYVTGTTGSTDFPTTPGVDQTANGNLDIFVAKFSPAGAVLYSTYFGGPCVDVARDIAVDAAGNAYVTGGAGGGCYGDSPPGVLVAKLDDSGGVVYATVLGGTLADTSLGHAIAVDADGHAFVTGVASNASHDFPTTPGAFRTVECANVYSFAGDGFVARLSADGGTLMYSTFLCGSGDDSPTGIAVDADGNAYVGGTTASSDFPTVAAFQDTRTGGPVGVTGFVSKLSPDGTDLIYSTYLGGSTSEAIGDIAVDGQGNAYVTGETASDDFPTTPGVLQEHPGARHCIQGCTDAFVTKIAPNGSALVYSTYLFGELDDAGAGIALDGAGNVHVVGATSSSFFPIVDAFQATFGGVADAFVAKLTPDGARLLRSSYLGGSASGASPRTGWDTGSGIAVTANGTAYVAGYTQSFDFPTTATAVQSQLAATNCDFLGTPCGDIFVAGIAAAGPGVTPPIWLNVTPEEATAGGTLSATWAGLPAPGTTDHLRLYALGASGNDVDDVIWWWQAPGTAAGTLSLELPTDLAAGAYEVRLLSPDPDFSGLLAAMARSDAIYVAPSATSSTTTTLPSAACGQPVTSGAEPAASDCLFILRVAVGVETCTPECICAVSGSLPVLASSALQCLRYAVGLPTTLDCPCD